MKKYTLSLFVFILVFSFGINYKKISAAENFGHVFSSNLSSSSKGDSVKELQTFLIGKSFLSGKADGKYGKNTINAVKKLQKKLALPVTGNLDTQTRLKLKSLPIDSISSVSANKVVASVKTVVPATNTSVSKLVSKQGTWHVVEKYSSMDSSGPFSKLTLNSTDKSFELSIKENSYCDSRLKDPTDASNTKPFCEPFTSKNDGTFTGSRLEAWGGFMKLNGSRLEFYEGGKGFMKYVLEKK
ncbi:MAG: peptidoglycan-binding domain-containing protein [Minisyncoccia bacterium]